MQNQQGYPLIQVTGEGRLDLTPDTAVVTLGFTARADQATAAYQQVATALTQVVRTLTEAGITREQLQTQQINVQPVYREEQPVGYEATSTLRVTLRDPAAAGGVIDRAVAAGANRVLGITFEVRDPGAYEGHALAAAVQHAYRQAATLAQTAGVALGPVWRMEAEPAEGPVVPAFRTAALEAMPVLPGTQTLTRRVRVEFLIGQRT